MRISMKYSKRELVKRRFAVHRRALHTYLLRKFEQDEEFGYANLQHFMDEYGRKFLFSATKRLSPKRKSLLRSLWVHFRKVGVFE